MGFRFRRSIKIAPGVRINVSKSGMSTLIGALIFLWAFGAAAQRPPSDNELRASYCIGFTTANLALKIDRDSEALKKEEREHKDRLDRLRAYINPRIGELDPIPMNFAMKRGEIDFERAMKELFACIDSCPIKSFADAAICEDKCSKGELVQRMQQCRNLSWLPF